MMTFNEALVKRINEICAQKNITISQFALRAGITPSAIYDIRNKGKNPNIITLKKLCDRNKISIREFFEPDYINNASVEDDF